MIKSIIAPLLLVALFGLVVLYHEDVFLLADREDKVDNSMAHLATASESSNYNSHSTVDDEHWQAIINAAEAFKYTCANSSLPTSIHATLSADNDSIVVSLPDEEPDEGEGIFVSLDFTFRAYDKDLQPQQTGGDVFVIDYQSYWPSSLQQLDEKKNNSSNNNYTVFKSATFTHDHLNGKYSATLFLPRIVLDHHHVNISLRHYYTCHEGLKLPDQLRVRNGYHTLEQFGPLHWQKAAEVVLSVLKSLPPDDSVGTITKSLSTNNHLPMCSENPNNEFILHGAWIEEQQLEPPLNITKMTLDARWIPFHCTLDDDLQKQQQPTALRHFRIGDSTMPGRIVESFLGKDSGRPGIKHKIGIPYAPYFAYFDNAKGQHDQFLGVLGTFRNHSQSTFDTFLYSGGLHHLLHGHYNVPATAAIVLRTICQVGLTFPGNILLRGANPLQQHQFHVVDITSLNVQRLNWELHSRLRKAGRRLADICLSIPAEEMASFVSHPGKDGNILRNREAYPILLQKYNYSWERDSTDDQKQLSDWMQGLSLEERSERYGKRTVRWINLEGFLLSRPQMYRKNDKIHDSALFFGPEWNVMSIIEGYA